MIDEDQGKLKNITELFQCYAMITSIFQKEYYFY